jgi:hypothetical protein
MANLLVLFPVGWLSGLSFLLPLVIVPLAAYRLRHKVDWIILVAAALPCFLALSLLLRTVHAGVDLRTLAAVYNIYVLTGGVAFFGLMRYAIAQDLQRGGFGKLRSWAMLVFLVAALAGITPFLLYLAGFLDKWTVVPTLFGLVGREGAVGILTFYTQVILSRPDWFFMPTVRFPGMGIYPTEGAMIVTGWALLALAMRTHHGLRFRARMGWELIALLAVALTASRAMTLAFVVSALLVMIPSFGGRARPALLVNASLRLSLLVLLALAAYFVLLENALSVFHDARPSSSATRLDSYRVAVDWVLQENLLFGLGIKPLDGSITHIPIGSHSTFVSMFTKGGLLSLSAFVVAAIVLAWPTLKSMIFGFGVLGESSAREIAISKLLARAVLVGLAWSVMADIDAPVLGCLTFFGIMGAGWAWASYLHSKNVTGGAPTQTVDGDREMTQGS